MADDGTAKGPCYVCGVEVTYDEYDPSHNVGIIEGDDEEIIMCDEHGIMAENMADEITPETHDYLEACD